MRHILLVPILLVTLAGFAQQSPQPGRDQSETKNPPIDTANPNSCLVCNACPNLPVDKRTVDICLLCKACSATASPVDAPVQSRQVYQPTVGVTPPAVVHQTAPPPEWRTRSGAIDLHYQVGAVFRGPTIAACDISSGYCQGSGRTHLAGDLGATYWIRPGLGLSLDTVLMDGGSIAGTTQNSIGAYLGLQFQRSRGAIRPYLEVAPGYVHSFTTGSSNFAELNPDLASVKAGGGLRFMLGRRWGAKVGVAALPSFSGIGHQTPVVATAGFFWQSKGRSDTE